jgi:hypothetical protein
MKIVFSELPSYIINLEADVDKKNSAINALGLVGISNVTVVKALKRTPGRTGLAMSFKKIFSKIDGHSEPILICEDDILLNPFFKLKEIDIPDDADALYIGTSIHGRSAFINPYTNPSGEAYQQLRDRNREGEKIVVRKVTDDLYQIYNMLSAHAVVMISKSYTQFLKNALDLPILNGGHQDLVRATTMPYYKVYALDVPAFYQSGPHEHLSNIKISSLTSKNVSFRLEDL